MRRVGERGGTEEKEEEEKEEEKEGGKRRRRQTREDATRTLLVWMTPEQRSKRKKGEEEEEERETWLGRGTQYIKNYRDLKRKRTTFLFNVAPMLGNKQTFMVRTRAPDTCTSLKHWRDEANRPVRKRTNNRFLERRTVSFSASWNKGRASGRTKKTV